MRAAPNASVCAVTTFNARVQAAGFIAASEKDASMASRSLNVILSPEYKCRRVKGLARATVEQESERRQEKGN
jgi:hypothetical protein